MKIFVGVVVSCGVAVLALWWWVTRIPTDRRDEVSQAWINEHKREGRH
jgi:hypothetical protein